jgi:hypothetical protein
MKLERLTAGTRSEGPCSPTRKLGLHSVQDGPSEGVNSRGT